MQIELLEIKIEIKSIYRLDLGNFRALFVLMLFIFKPLEILIEIN